MANLPLASVAFKFCNPREDDIKKHFSRLKKLHFFRRANVAQYPHATYAFDAKPISRERVIITDGFERKRNTEIESDETVDTLPGVSAQSRVTVECATPLSHESRLFLPGNLEPMVKKIICITLYKLAINTIWHAVWKAGDR